MIRRAVFTVALVAFTVSQAFAFKESPRPIGKVTVGLTVGSGAVGGGGFVVVGGTVVTW